MGSERGLSVMLGTGQVREESEEGRATPAPPLQGNTPSQDHKQISLNGDDTLNPSHSRRGSTP